MKNVTKILIAVTLCAAVFASTQRIGALGGNAAFWPGDEANIAAFPAQINNHGYLQLTGAGAADAGADLVFNHNGTAWSLGFSNQLSQLVLWKRMAPRFQFAIFRQSTYLELQSNRRLLCCFLG